jgi:hypothetical protein
MMVFQRSILAKSSSKFQQISVLRKCWFCVEFFSLINLSTYVVFFAVFKCCSLQEIQLQCLVKTLPMHASKLALWARPETEHYASLVKRHGLSSSAAARGLRGAAECVQIALGYCSLLGPVQRRSVTFLDQTMSRGEAFGLKKYIKIIHCQNLNILMKTKFGFSTEIWVEKFGSTPQGLHYIIVRMQKLPNFVSRIDINFIHISIFRDNRTLTPQSHQNFHPIPTVKLLGIILRNKCWPTTFHTITEMPTDGI